MQLTAENIQQQIPYYLTREQQEGLVKELAGFPAGMNYYTLKHRTDLLQGDGWSHLQVVRFESGERKGVKGIILSNSCDINPENRREFPVRLMFVPILRLEAFKEQLRRVGVSEEVVAAKIGAIREQKVTSIFFLPKGGSLDSDYIAVLDDVHTMPAAVFWTDTSKAKIFTLSLAGFYLFLLKLSVHLCRFHENVDRDDSAA